MIELRFRIKKCQLIFWCFFFSYFKACFVLFVIISYHFDVYTLKCIHSCFFFLLNLNFYIKMKYWYLKIKYKWKTLPSVSIKWLKTLTEWSWKTGKVVEIHWSNVENPTLQSDGLNHICKIQNTYYTDIVIHVIQS